MKKSTAPLLLVLGLIFLALAISCAKKPAAPQAGQAKAEDMMSFFPKSTRGLIVIDVHRIMQTEVAQKAIEEDKNFQKYQEFIQETGIDPKKDVFFFIAGLGSNEATGNKQEGVAVLNLRYNRDLLLSKVKKESIEIQETDYNGVRLYHGSEAEEEKPFSGAFLDDSNIVVGNDALVKGVIDVYQKKADNILKNPEMASLLKGVNKTAMVYGAFLVPPEALIEAASKNPMLSPFESVNAVLLAFDYRDKAFEAEIKAQSADAEKNKQMAEALTGFKALGSAAAAKNPELGELLKGIEIVSASDHVKISASLSEVLLEHLAQKMKSQKAEAEEQKD